MGTRTGTEPASIFANVGVHADVGIKLTMDRDGGPVATIGFGRNEELSVEFSDVNSLERLAAVATDGARRLRERIAANSPTQPQADRQPVAGADR